MNVYRAVLHIDGVTKVTFQNEAHMKKDFRFLESPWSVSQAIGDLNTEPTD